MGQTYELLNMHFYALFYYRKAMMLQPTDARLWSARAPIFSLRRVQEFVAAFSFGGAKIFQKLSSWVLHVPTRQNGLKMYLFNGDMM